MNYRLWSALMDGCYAGYLACLCLFCVDALRLHYDDLVGSGAADVARLVPELRDTAPMPERPAGDPEQERWRLLQSVTDFLRNARR